MIRAVVAQAMIVALQRVADQLAHRQRQVTMGAAILERDRRSVLDAVEHDRLAEDDAAQRFSADLVVGSRDVPVIFQEHGVTSGLA